VVIVVLFLRATGGVSLADAGFGTDRRTFLLSGAANFALGLLAIAPLVALLLATGVRAPAASPDETLAALAVSALATGLSVGLLEEIYFRGLVLCAALRRGEMRSALIATSLFFAVLHFLVVREDPAAVRWYSGFEHIAAGLSQLADPATVGAFVALTAAGLLLGVMRLRQGHVGGCAGFHAGWVTGYTLTHRLTDVAPASLNAWVAGPDGVMGWLAFVWVAALMFAYVVAARQRR
jgi:membrane protease YdiL (CAAX protease family)